MKLSDLKECPDCGSDNVRYSKKDDELFCRDCGLILNELPDESDKDFKKSHGME